MRKTPLASVVVDRKNGWSEQGVSPKKLVPIVSTQISTRASARGVPSACSRVPVRDPFCFSSRAGRAGPSFVTTTNLTLLSPSPELLIRNVCQFVPSNTLSPCEVPIQIRPPLSGARETT